MTQRLFAGEIYWWLVAAFVGAIGWGLPAFLVPGAPVLTQLILSMAGMFLTGGLIGFQRAERVWRWGIAAVLLLPIAEGIRTGSVVYVLAQIPASIPPGVAAFAGAFCGMILRKGRREIAESKPGHSDLMNILATFSTGILCSVPYVLSSELERLNTIIALALLFVLAFFLSFSFPERVWRWALAAGLALPATVLLRTVLGAAAGLPAPGISGIDLLVAGAYGLPAAFVGAHAAALIARIRRNSVDRPGDLKE